MSLPMALVLLAATQDVPPPPLAPEPVRSLAPRFSCLISQLTDVGTVGVQRSVDPDTRQATEALFSWEARFGDDAIALNASWHAAPGDYSLIQLAYLNPDRRHSYRLQIRRRTMAERGAREMQLEGPLTPSTHGFVSIWTEWGPLMGTIAGEHDPHIRVVDGAGAIVVDERLDPARFVRAREMAERLRPGIDAMVADYRNRCEFRDRTFFPDQNQVPG